MVDEIVILGIKKTNKKYKVTTSLEDYIFDEDTIIKYMILKDKVFSKKDFEEIIKEGQINQSVNKALRYLGYGPRTTHEVRVYLKNEEQVESAILKLQELGYLNDQLFTTQYLDYVVRNKKGPLFFKNKLKEKGVEEIIIAEAVDKYPEEDLEDNIRLIASKFLNVHHDKPPKSIKRQLAQKLIRDGFQSDRVFSFLNTLEIEDNSNERLKKDLERLREKHQRKNLDEASIKQKVVQSLLQKGYEYSSIKKLIE